MSSKKSARKKSKPDGFFTKREVVESLRLQITGSQAEFAVKLNISPQLLSDVLILRRPVPESALALLGLEAVEQLYRRKGKR